MASMISYPRPDGQSVNAYLAEPESGSGPGVVVIQEWWGLNDHIKDIANRYANEGFVAIAPDLYRGRIAADPSEASQMMHDLSQAPSPWAIRRVQLRVVESGDGRAK